MTISKTVKHLIWKDVVTLRPLFYSAIIGVLGINILILFVQLAFSSSATPDIDPFIMLWILMPNLMALGVPPMLVGNEEETGTLSWLRTLPIRWQTIVDVKFFLGFASVVSVWLIASVMLYVFLSLIGTNNSTMGDALRPMSVANFGFFTLQLMLIGFILSYLFRSPVVSLIVLIPTIFVISWVSSFVGHYLLTGTTHWVGQITHISPQNAITTIACAIGFLTFLWILQRLFARSRFRSKTRQRYPKLQSKNASLSVAPAYRPTFFFIPSRPTQTSALLWQQMRQAGPLVIPLCMIGVIATLAYKFKHMFGMPLSFFGEIAPVVIGLACSWLGVLVFHGDNVRRRNGFFADRGISPTRIWWTRMALPLVCFLLIAFFALIPNGRDGMMNSLIFASVLFVGFGTGQLTAQLSARPLLCFLAAPAVHGIAYLGLLLLLMHYYAYHWTAGFMFPVLMFGTWRMCGRWIENQVGPKFNIRILAYLLLAVAVPYLILFGHRWWTTPPIDHAWRAKMMALNQTIHERQTSFLAENPSFADATIYPDAFRRDTRFVAVHPIQHEDVYHQLKEELADTAAIGAHVSFGELHSILGSSARVLREKGVDNSQIGEIKKDALTVMANWAKTIRERAVIGMATPDSVTRIADPIENLLPYYLKQSNLTQAERAEIVSRLPSKTTRNESRKAALATLWMNWQQQSWVHCHKDECNYFKSIFQDQVLSRVGWMSIERNRSDRYFDEAIKATLEYADGEAPKEGSLQWRKWRQIWRQVQGPDRSEREWKRRNEGRDFYAFFWSSKDDLAIEKLKDRYIDEVDQ